ncbi:MAG: M15 family metallopeptidase [Bacteroidota bacterium]
MKKIVLQLIIILFLPWVVFSQNEKQNPYHLNIISTVAAYQDECRKDKQNQLVDLKTEIPDIILDIRYATDNNFTHKQVYSTPRAFLRQPAAIALLKVQKELEKEGLGLKVYDAYRPYAATMLFYDLIKDTLFVASPVKGSRHNRGCAVDLTLVNLKTGAELEMPTGYDDFTEKASPVYNDLPATAKENRKKLIDVMKKQGFEVYGSEWWHFDFKGWQTYTLMDISFEELEKP